MHICSRCVYVSLWMLYTLVLDYKFRNLILHPKFNLLLYTRIHTHTQIRCAHSGTICVVKQEISIWTTIRFISYFITISYFLLILN